MAGGRVESGRVESGRVGDKVYPLSLSHDCYNPMNCCYSYICFWKIDLNKITFSLVFIIPRLILSCELLL